MSEIFSDSKSFVDMKLRINPEIVLARFQHLLNQTENRNPSVEQIKNFVSEYFECGVKLDEVEPEDWKTDLPFTSALNLDIAEFCLEINRRWKMLGRRTGEDVNKNPELFSLLPLPYTAVVPGGRFREIYYWDTYWILRGLLVSNMLDTARGMVENLVFLLEKLGFVPNGGRVYYTRSQPPLLASMVWDYYLQSGDVPWTLSKVGSLEKEWYYWLRNHSVDVQGKTMFRYCCSEETPRPESYREDYSLAENLDIEDRGELFKELRSAAESGWDFSSRWFDDPEKGDLSSTSVRNILPVDLNSFLAKSAKIIADVHKLAGNRDQENIWMERADKLIENIEELMWNDEEGTWFDLEISTLKQRKYFFASNLTPLWANAVPTQDLKMKGRRSVEYIQKVGALNNPEGIPTTFIQSGQQWDFPNVWPPLEHMIITGLGRCKDESADKLARELTKTTISRNLQVFKSQGHMFEKYDCRSTETGGGSGGEYSVQLGFGWSNGVSLDLIHMYPELWQS
ncbi:trehalase [Eurytemora carolleeae]|uniref:trehalase n=1 Tax=Eurytemora carolleeae TaxID=1294199 RepID=UPI000C75C6EE|nr:trehalase [Eurytemora carolleeae]|eukprot:XP_023319723.1 trehalase-like [Eurytemora affinis]